MTQTVDSRVGVQTLIDDYDAICKVLQLCIDGESKGDSGKLKEAFHTDSRMFGALGGTRYDVPIQALFDMADGGLRTPAATAPASCREPGVYTGSLTDCSQPHLHPWGPPSSDGSTSPVGARPRRLLQQKRAARVPHGAGLTRQGRIYSERPRRPAGVEFAFSGTYTLTDYRQVELAAGSMRSQPTWN
jgi:hypothetical protein